MKQPQLLPQSEAAQARVLLAAALEELAPLLQARHPRGHLATCRLGQWVDGFTGPDGAPCSKRCLLVRHLVADLQAYLMAEATAE